MSREIQRITVFELYKSRMKSADIVCKTGYKKQTVYDIVKSYKETSGTADRPRSGRPTTAALSENNQKVSCRIQRNCEQSMRKMAKELGISQGSVWNIVTKKLRLCSYNINRVHFLNETMKAKQQKKSCRMLCLLAGARMSKVFFTDEKIIFTIEPLHNRQNCRQLLKKGQQKSAAAKTISRVQFSSSVIVWAGICATGKTPLIFIDRNFKINAASY